MLRTPNSSDNPATAVLCILCKRRGKSEVEGFCLLALYIRLITEINVLIIPEVCSFFK